MTLPDVPESFSWAQSAAGPVLKCGPLEAVAAHVFTTRELRLSSMQDWDRIAAALGVSSVLTVNQVHGRTVVAASSDPARAAERPDADALITLDPAQAVGVRAADCAPILLADPATGAVAAVHAGWRGTAAGIVAAAVSAMTREYGSRPGDLLAAIGPSIRPCCYEVGSELVDAFAAAGHPRHLVDRWFVLRDPGAGIRDPGGRLWLDVPKANRDQLLLAGLADERIYDCGLCTAMHLDVLTSFRAEKEKAGRLAAVIRPRAGRRPAPANRI
jgi:YfiH family protein